MHRITSILSSSLLAAAATAQLSVVIPAGCDVAAGNSSNAFPWGTAAATWPGLRLMCIYDAVNFTSQTVTGPILINRLRWRPNDGAAAFAGGTFQQADVRLSTCPVNYTSLTTNFATNHGPDLTTVYSGPVVHSAGSGGTVGVPAAWTVDVVLTTPFLYDPAAGDLVIDCDYPGGANFQGGTLPQMDVHGTGSNAGRIWASAAYPTANGSALNHGVVVEVGYGPPGGGGTFATANGYGTGCYDRPSATVYEQFPANTFDLSNTTISLLPTGNGYVVLPGLNQWFTPVAANLGLTDDSVSLAQPLGFTLTYPGGSTSAVFVSSNGFVWAQSNSNNGCCGGDPLTLGTLGARWCALWNDLNPGVGGTVTFDTDPANGAAYVTFTNVPEFAQVGNLNTFQIAFFASGVVEYRYQACVVTSHVTLTGWSPGANNRDPGSVDLSASMPIITQPDLYPLGLSAAPRPVLGNTVVLTTTNIPAGSPLGALLMGIGQINPGIDLTGIGMPGCRQYLSIDASQVFFPAGTTAATNFGVPNNAAFVSVHVFAQSAVFAPGLNPLGVISSNGVDLRIGTF